MADMAACDELDAPAEEAAQKERRAPKKAKDAAASLEIQMPESFTAGLLWRVIGGGDKGGIVVRVGEALQSLEAAARLSTGALLRQEELRDQRLRYKRLAGDGPDDGWVSLSAKGRPLVERANESQFQTTVELVVGDTRTLTMSPETCVSYCEDLSVRYNRADRDESEPSVLYTCGLPAPEASSDASVSDGRWQHMFEARAPGRAAFDLSGHVLAFEVRGALQKALGGGATRFAMRVGEVEDLLSSTGFGENWVPNNRFWKEKPDGGAEATSAVSAVEYTTVDATPPGFCGGRRIIHKFKAVAAGKRSFTYQGKPFVISVV